MKALKDGDNWAVEGEINPLSKKKMRALWKAARESYWTDKGKEELNNPSGKYSPENIQRMIGGNAPRMRVLVLENGTPPPEVKDISIELHHTYIPQRQRTAKAHERWNLTEASPWAHAAMDSYRKIGQKQLISVILSTRQWKP